MGWTAWTTREVATVRDGVDRGLTAGQIQRKLAGRTTEAVKARIRALKTKAEGIEA